MVAIDKEHLIAATYGALQGLKSRDLVQCHLCQRKVWGVSGSGVAFASPSSTAAAATSVIFANMSATSTVCARVRVANEVDDSSGRTDCAISRGAVKS